jgi:Tol biopolymer transport system component
LDLSISADGRYVGFQSLDALVPGDTNQDWDQFVYDRVTHRTERVSIPSAPGQPDGGVSDEVGAPRQALSFDGRYVVFSYTDTWFPAPAGRPQTYVRDRLNGTTELVSVSSSGQPAAEESRHAAISADGRYVTFYSSAGNLAPAYDRSAYDVFLHDRITRTTLLVSAGPSTEGHKNAGFPAISSDGLLVAFAAGDLGAEPFLNHQVYVFERPRSGS